MIFDFFGELTSAIVVATVAWFAFSAVWYSVPPLSKAWQRASKVDMSTEAHLSPSSFIPTLIGYFVTTVVIALIAKGIGATEVADGIALGVVPEPASAQSVPWSARSTSRRARRTG